ncbi:MAG: recombination protein RecR [Spirochaetes bacterium GWF1_31_7]|nr:MAG: recombination protein RecR [Spirochaetes bacterium GWE1_32_154]OHD50023.1 MAG: recombination protein RecR [Spirochaetes bacterium GWE2_31_10]OHD52337.1 MAG: recombination protein RecR [Spirochaetes bacterium GWF1_31_7]OHD73184.1 MAG: recombination protein RecR [Spirochaetes bacterium RIFOXYB1_FULL_32_8]HBI38488.1 recombination protein RecR [Spirochaetia bacterium]
MFDINDLITALSKLPGIGKKSASRLTFFLLKNKDISGNLLTILSDVIINIKQCELCGQYTIKNICDLCSNEKRNKNKLCIVEEQNDMNAIEETGSFDGIYHILMGAINPLSGFGPEKLKINELKSRITKESFSEILIATNPTIEGEATFLYLKNIINSLSPSIKISKLATGIPMGGSLEYSDKLTLTKAILTKQYL